MEPIQNELKMFQDRLAINLFGCTLEDAQNKNICISCKSSIDTTNWEPSDVDEYLISGLCPDCFEDLTASKYEDDEE